MLLQLKRIARQVSVGTKFQPLIAGTGEFIEESCEWNLLRVVGEPHTP